MGLEKSAPFILASSKASSLLLYPHLEMADPISVIGALSATASVIQLLGKSIIRVNGLRDTWRGAGLSISTFASQLVVFKAALTKIHDLVASCDCQIEQDLLADLDSCLSCCEVLARRIDEELSVLRIQEDGSLQISDRIRLLVRRGNITDLYDMVFRQSATLGLLLTACNR